MTDTLLPDVSEFQAGQSAPDWAGIKKQNGGAGIIRVGYGTGHLDHTFVTNYTAMKAQKFSFIGLYQYMVAGQDPAAQARAFCQWIGPPSAVAPGTVFIADLEEGAGNQRGRAETWLGLVDKFYGLDKQPLPAGPGCTRARPSRCPPGWAPIFSSPRRTWVAAYSAAEPKLGHTRGSRRTGRSGRTSPRGPDAAGSTRRSTTGRSPGWPPWAGRPPAPAAPDNRHHGEYVSGGMFPLAALAAKLGWPANTLLRMTACHYGTFGDDLGLWINDVLTGKRPWTTPVPKGVRLWCD